MKKFLALFSLVFKRFFSLRYLDVLSGILLLFIYSSQLGIREHKKIYDNNREFKEIEGPLFKTIYNYVEYSESIVIYLIQPQVVGLKGLQTSGCYEKCDAWSDMIESNKHLLKMQKKQSRK